MIRHLNYTLPGTIDGSSENVSLWVDEGGYLELQDSKYDWLIAYAFLSKEQMAELGRFLLEASECG